MSQQSRLTPNSLAFIALSNEYCDTLEQAASADRDSLVRSMLRLLPRIYISASDIPDGSATFDDIFYIDDSLDEDSYNSVRRTIETALGEDDTYLEVFEEDMKYSDTPIAASIAEGLSDIYQVLFNFLAAVKNSTDDNIAAAISIVADDFRHYWSRPLCNVLRALNSIRYDHD